MPLKTADAHPLAPLRVSPLTEIDTNTAPMMVPMTLKKPGAIAVAPRNTAAKAGNRRSLPADALALPARESCRTPARPAIIDAITKLDQTFRLTLMPTSFADELLDPIA